MYDLKTDLGWLIGGQQFDSAIKPLIVSENYFLLNLLDRSFNGKFKVGCIL